MTKILPNSTKHRHMEPEYKTYELWVGSYQSALCHKLQFNQFFSQTNLNFSERELGLLSDEKKKNRDCDIVQDFKHPIAVFSIWTFQRGEVCTQTRLETIRWRERRKPSVDIFRSAEVFQGGEKEEEKQQKGQWRSRKRGVGKKDDTKTRGVVFELFGVWT